MTRAKRYILYCAILCCVSGGLVISINKSASVKAPRIPGRLPAKETKEKKEYPARVGETMTYDIAMGKLRIGTAVFRQMEDADLNGDAAHVIQLETNLARFKDKEIIYSDPETRLPLKVIRDIQNWLAHENIIEEYDQKNYKVTITKGTGPRTNTMVIEKDKPIHNAILLPHFVRDMPALKPGMTFTVNLPTKSIEVKLAALEEVNVPVGKFKAYHFISSPRQIEIWISADERKIPLKIVGVGMFSYVLLLRKYQPQNADNQFDRHM